MPAKFCVGDNGNGLANSITVVTQSGTADGCTAGRRPPLTPAATVAPSGGPGHELLPRLTSRAGSVEGAQVTA